MSKCFFHSHLKPFLFILQSHSSLCSYYRAVGTQKSSIYLLSPFSHRRQLGAAPRWAEVWPAPAVLCLSLMWARFDQLPFSIVLVSKVVVGKGSLLLSPLVQDRKRTLRQPICPHPRVDHSSSKSWLPSDLELNSPSQGLSSWEYAPLQISRTKQMFFPPLHSLECKHCSCSKCR